MLTITETLRAHGVVGKLVEFTGPALADLPVPDRATIANMSPEFGSTAAYFPIDDRTLDYLLFTGRTPEKVALVESYAREQGLWHDPAVDLMYDEWRGDRPGHGGPLHRRTSSAAATHPPGRPPSRQSSANCRPVPRTTTPAGHGAVVVAAITSCTNTSNPAVMVAAGLLASNAVERGLASKPWVKTTLSPGSRVVMDYLGDAGLTPYLEKLGFHLAGFGCMTCIGASGALIDEVAEAVRTQDLTVAAVLSGNRNFEGRIQPDVRLNYLASPPLVIAYALAGRMDIDLLTEPLNSARRGRRST